MIRIAVMIRLSTTILPIVALGLGCAPGAMAQGAQRAGSSVTVRIGEVTGAQRVELKDDSVIKGALIGGAIGLAAGSGKGGKTARTRAGVGAAAGGLAGAAKPNPTGMKYSVRTVDGATIQVVSDQMQIRMGDCVAVEESGGRANIRRVSETACQAESKSALKSKEVQRELQEEASECASARQAVLAADTDEKMELAIRKMSILCD